MPRNNMPANYNLTLARMGGLLATAYLADLTTADGQTYFWCDVEGTYAKADGSGSTLYSPYIKQAGPLRRSRNTTTDAGDFILQNLSGNSIDRDVAAAVKNHEFEGALCLLRFMDTLNDVVFDQFDGYLSEQDGDEEQFTFRLLQLLDGQQYYVADDVFAETCTLRFKSNRCGSTGTNTICTKKFIAVSPGATDCTAVERFTGTPNPAPYAIYPPPVQGPYDNERNNDDRDIGGRRGPLRGEVLNIY